MTTEMLLALGATVFTVLSWIVFNFVLARVVKALDLHVKQAEMRMYDEVKHHGQRVDGMTGQYRALKKETADRNNKVGSLEKRVKDLEEQIDGDGGLVEKVDEALLSVDAILDNSADDDEEYAERPTGTFPVLPAPSAPVTWKSGSNGKAK